MSAATVLAMEVATLEQCLAAANRELDQARAREVLLREVLEAARAFMAAELREERGCGPAIDLRESRNDALQRVRDLLWETGPVLLRGRERVRG